MTLTRRARGAWPIVGAVIALGAAKAAAFQQRPEHPASASDRAPGAAIAGRILTPDGRPLLRGAVILTPLDGDNQQAVAPKDIRIAPDGTFRFGQVPSGRYRIRARGETAPGGPPLFATFVLTMAGGDVNNVQILLRPGGTLDGELTLETPHNARAPILSKLRVRAPSADGGGFGDPVGGVVDASGRFVLRGLMSGDHQVVIEGLPPPWVVKSVLLGGRDISDAGVEVREGQELRGAQITITDHASEVSGRVRDQGAPVADVPVLVYPVAPQFWIRAHRRMRLTRADDEGRFSLRGLPEGEYFAVASGAIDETALGWRERLDAIRAVATPLSISGADARITLELPLVAVLPGAPVPTR